jgi:hypothetical protein
LLTARYIELKRWPVVEDELGIGSPRTRRRVHSEALEAVQAILQGQTKREPRTAAERIEAMQIHKVIMPTKLTENEQRAFIEAMDAARAKLAHRYARAWELAEMDTDAASDGK